MNIKRNITFSPENRKKNGKTITENVPIRMRVTYDGNRVDFTTGYRIDVDKWDKNKQRVKNGCTNKLKQTASQINTDLNRYYTDIQEVFKGYEVADIVPTIEHLKTAFSNKYKRPEAVPEPDSDLPSFFDIFDEFVKESGHQRHWTDATYEKFRAVKNHLKNFNPLLTFEQLTEEGLNDYVNFLRTIRKLRNSTIQKQLGFLKWFLRWSASKGYNQNTTFQYFKPKIKNAQKKVIFLTWEELNQLKDYDIPDNKQYLERVRDVFLFQCFTGLRYSDVYNLRRSDIKDEYIEITTVKTIDSLRIDLNKHSKAILDKYSEYNFENDKVLPVISNQKMNDYLKELGELAGIDEPVRETYYRGNERIDEVTPKYALLGTHAGRRTFICNALSLGIAPQVVMKWTGHSDYKAMKPYIDIADATKAQAMDKFNQL